MLPPPQRKDPNRRHRELTASVHSWQEQGPAAAAAVMKPRDRAGTKSMSALRDTATSQLWSLELHPTFQDYVYIYNILLFYHS